jgi:dTDP-4-amino-4,6-dideoxygalactose transaminase
MTPSSEPAIRPDYLVFGKPLIGEEEIAEVVASMRAGWLGTGPKVAEFERRIAKYKGVKHAVAVNSCTAGLHLSCVGLDIQPGDEVITTAMTFCATVNAIVHAGATPVLADIDPVSMNIDPDEIRRRITPKTRALLPVHYAGRACDMGAITAIAREHNLLVIEDCAHAIETQWHGQAAGTFGNCGVLSFYATKNLVTGEGGMILTNDDTVAMRMKNLALHGLSKDAWKRFSDDGYRHYDVVEIGFKYNMMDLQAAIGMHQCDRLEALSGRRREIWNRYNQSFADLPIQSPAALDPKSRHALHLYTIEVDASRCGVERDDFINALHRRNIGTGVHYRSIPEYTVYQRRFGWRPEDWPHAMHVGRTTVSLPLSGALTDQDVEDVIAEVHRALRP